MRTRCSLEAKLLVAFSLEIFKIVASFMYLLVRLLYLAIRLFVIFGHSFLRLFCFFIR